MQRIILILFFLVFTAVFSGLGYLYKNNKTRVYPLPYMLAKGTYPLDNIAQEADVLIIGDQLGVEFNSQVQKLIENLSEKLQKPLSIYNLSVENEGIHRTLAKIRNMDKLPPIIIYMGGSSEFHEDLYPSEIKKYKLNYKIFMNDYAQTAVMLFPILSRFIYIPDHVKELNEKIVPAKRLNDRHFQFIAQSTFYFYQEQLMDLVDLISEKGSTPIIVTHPINYEAKVNKVCDNSMTDDITIEQVDIKNMIESNKIKEAYNRTLILDGISVGNAQTKYLLGISQITLGKLKKARLNLTLAKALDCAPKGAHPVINQIQRKVIRERALENIDFDRMVNLDLGKEVLFLDGTSPQFIYWEKLENEMTNKLKRILDL